MYFEVYQSDKEGKSSLSYLHWISIHSLVNPTDSKEELLMSMAKSCKHKNPRLREAHSQQKDECTQMWFLALTILA